MAQKRTDIELEMSRFEEEISRLAPNTNKQSAVISAPPVQSITIKAIQMPLMSQYQQMTSVGTVYTNSMPIKLPTTYKSIETPISMPVPISSTSAVSGFKRDATVLATASDIQAKRLKDAANSAASSLANLNKKKKKYVRMAGGQKWEDETLNEWDSDDFRLFCGDLGNEVNDELLARAFQKYPSFIKARVVRDKRTGKTKGFGFVSFKDSQDFIKAMREMNGKYVGNRPIKLRKSNWKDRNIEIVKKKEVEKAKMGFK